MKNAETFLDYFSSTFLEAEDLFLDACKVAGIEAELIDYPVSGPRSEDLHVGVCRVGPQEAENILLILSGTHGVEGYAGAAIQVGILRNLADINLPENTALVMVHLINPWGLAWNRRETEENIDLFRNFHYCNSPIEADPLYDRIDDDIDWSNWGNISNVAKTRLIEDITAKYGEEKIVTAIRRGQHHRPKSMTYHGNGPSVNKVILDGIIKDQTAGAKHVALLDIHTGFGEYGKGMIVAYDAEGSKKYGSLSALFGEGLYTPGMDNDTPTHDISPYSFITEIQPQAEVLCGVLEFGTYPPEITREVFLASSYYHNYGDPLSAEARKMGAHYRDFCYPEYADWKKVVWERGFEVTKIMLGIFEHWPNISEIKKS